MLSKNYIPGSLTSIIESLDIDRLEKDLSSMGSLDQKKEHVDKLSLKYPNIFQDAQHILVPHFKAAKDKFRADAVDFAKRQQENKRRLEARRNDKLGGDYTDFPDVAMAVAAPTLSPVDQEVSVGDEEIAAAALRSKLSGERKEKRERIWKEAHPINPIKYATLRHGKLDDPEAVIKGSADIAAAKARLAMWGVTGLPTKTIKPRV